MYSRPQLETAIYYAAFGHVAFAADYGGGPVDLAAQPSLSQPSSATPSKHGPIVVFREIDRPTQSVVRGVIAASLVSRLHRS